MPDRMGGNSRVGLEGHDSIFGDSMKLTEMTHYPVKSCAGVGLSVSDLDRFGLEGDRRWMIVNELGRFLTQRDIAHMALITVSRLPGGIHLDFEGSGLDVPFPGEGTVERQVQVWSDHVNARDAGDEVAQWLSQRLASSARLVYMPPDTVRLVDGIYATEGETVGFADGFPLLLISRASLDDLNHRLQTPVPMNRFRPNLVVDGCEPFAEDHWRRIRIGAMEFDVAKACSRCSIPSIIQESGRRDPDINRALAGFRRIDGKICFGQNLLYQQTGQLSVGDSVEVLA
jgi:uncharacterized protein YcbX